MALLRLEHVSKSFDSGDQRLEILRDINLNLESGSIVVISGKSGSGKSTLLNIIGGLDRPDEGIVEVDGLNVADLSEQALTTYRSRSVGFIFQLHYLMRDFTAIENVMIPAYIAGMDRRSALESARRLLASVRLESRANHWPINLSGGERQRVAVARSLINNPSLILADEPTGSLDEENSRQVEFLLFFLARHSNQTLIVVTHDANLTRRADIHLRLEHGVLHPT